MACKFVSISYSTHLAVQILIDLLPRFWFWDAAIAPPAG